MKEHYITLFDSTFLPQGLALHKSLQRNAGDFQLWIVAMDESVRVVLERLSLPTINVMSLQSEETHSLLEVKSRRSIVEYCWTLTPFTPDMVFNRHSDINRVTYIDADMWLLREPSPLFQELETSGASTLLTPHGYSQRYQSEARYGHYCVQFLPFDRRGSQDIRREWQSECLDWCSSVPDDTRFGDQKYLDAWPHRYGNRVKVSNNPQWTQAPWNAQRFLASEAITFHFHKLRLLSSTRASLGLYAIPPSHVELIYRPYLRDIKDSIKDLIDCGGTFVQQLNPGGALDRLKSLVEFRLHNITHPTAKRTMKV